MKQALRVLSKLSLAMIITIIVINLVTDIKIPIIFLVSTTITGIVSALMVINMKDSD